MQRRSLDTPGGARAKERRALSPLAAFALLLAVFPVHAAKPRRLDWRQPQQIVKLQSIEVGDAPGHIISLGESHGRAIFKNGEVASVTFRYLSDYTRGTGPFWGYSALTFKDHSRIYARYRATATLAPDGRTTRFNGNFTFTRGVGRFRGIRGGGACTGHRYVTHARRAWLELDHFATYRLGEP